MDRRPKISETALNAVSEVSGMLGVNHSVAASALIEGAFRSGRYLQYIQEYLKRNPNLRQTGRASKHPIKWEQEESSTRRIGMVGETPKPGRYRYREWSLTRVGHPSARNEEGNGWYLQHPSLDEPAYLGKNTPAAKDAAKEIIQSFEFKEQHC